MPYDLSVRMTRTYRDGWAYLDQWESIGSYTIEARSKLEIVDDEDYCEPSFQKIFLRVESEFSDDEVKKALRSEFTHSSCQHDWDCCGCRSYYANEVKELSDGYWVVHQSSSRNY